MDDNSNNSRWNTRYESNSSHRRGFGKNYRGRGQRSNWRDARHQKGDFYEENRHAESQYSRENAWESGSEQSFGKRGDRSSSGGRGARHPPGLKGKEIGLWYANRSRGNKKANKAPLLSMDKDEAHAINCAIDGLASPEKMTHEDGGRQMKVESDAFDSFSNPEGFIANNGKSQDKNIDLNNILSRIKESEFKSAYQANLKGNLLRDEGLLNLLEANKPGEMTKRPEVDLMLYNDLQKRDSNSLYQKMLKVRKRLPSYEMKETILETIRNNQVVVLSGETGCGKTTQVAQFVLDDCIERKEGSTCRIVCTQPRRISAISVAERVAEERGEQLGSSVGYQIRLESKIPRQEGSILYCTTGIVLQWLQGDPTLRSVSHLILDEIHERDCLSDFLIAISKDLIRLRPDLRVILMSATLNADKFSTYFGGCPMIHIPGFTFAVQEYYLEDVLKFTSFCFPDDSENKKMRPWRRNLDSRLAMETAEFDDHIIPYLRNMNRDEYPTSVTRELHKRSSEELNLELIVCLLKHIAKQPPGAVLIFLPGWDQISKLHKLIQEDRFFNPGYFLVIPLHSMMPTVNQKEVFNTPPAGVRKIVIATNIAETSITIDDIVYVIDGGRIKMKNYDKETNIATLLPEWVTLANAKQRRGRAGRVQEGICYHLYTRAREQLLKDFPLPEIQRTRLEEVLLQLKILRLGSCKPYLTKVMDSPEDSVIDASIKMLHSINAFDESETLTPLGFHLARLPMDPLTGKMLLMGAIFSCLSPILTVASSLSFKDPFMMILGKEKLVDQCRVKWAQGTKSDHLMMVNVFDEWQKQGAQDGGWFVWENFLSSSVLKQLQNMRQQFTDILRDNNFVNTRNSEAEELNRNSHNISLVKAIITAGLYPNVARIIKRFGGKNKGHIRSIALPDVKKVSLHPKSINDKETWFEHSWFVYWEKIKTTKVHLYDTTLISNYPLLLFGQKLDYDPTENVINVDGFVRVKCDKQVADVIQKLRRELDNLLEYKITHPGITDWSEGSKEGRLLSLIVEIITSERDVTDINNLAGDNSYKRGPYVDDGESGFNRVPYGDNSYNQGPDDDDEESSYNHEDYDGDSGYNRGSYDAGKSSYNRGNDDHASGNSYNRGNYDHASGSSSYNRRNYDDHTGRNSYNRQFNDYAGKKRFNRGSNDDYGSKNRYNRGNYHRRNYDD